jgi:hypothetical protein
MVEARNKLNQERKEMVQKYLVAASNGRNLNFNVETIDVATPGMSSIPVNLYDRLRNLGPPAGAIPFRSGDAPAATTSGSTGSWQ